MIFIRFLNIKNKIGILVTNFFFFQELGKNLELAEALFRGVLTLQEAYHISVAQEDTDK